MNRRGFLSSLLGAASAMTLDPEKLLWVPGAKTISIPVPKIQPQPIGIYLRYIREYDRCMMEVKYGYWSASSKEWKSVPAPKLIDPIEADLEARNYLKKKIIGMPEDRKWISYIEG